MPALRVFFLICLLFTTPAFAETTNFLDLKWISVGDSQTEADSRFGALRVKKSKESTSPNEVWLDEKIIYKGDDYTYSSIYKVFQRSDADVALIGYNCGGSGCVTEGLSLVILKKDAEPKLIDDPFLESYANEIKFYQAGDILHFSLGYQEAKLKVATLTGERLKTQFIPVPPQALNEADCKWLYDALDACIRAREEDSACSAPIATFTGVYMRGVSAVADYPGYNQAGFDAHCQQACQTGKMPDYASFGVAACSKPKTASTAPIKVKTTTGPTRPIQNKSGELTKGCETVLSQGAAAWPCLQANLLIERKRLNKAYKTLFDSSQPLAQTELEAKQKAWLTERDAACGKLLADTPATDAVQHAPCVYQAIVKRADELEQLLKSLPATQTARPSTQTDQELWYKAIAKPLLIVRDQPTVTGAKLGTVPEGGKVKILEANIKKDFISGHQGAWVKIEWLDRVGYVFDGFLEKM